MDKLIFSSVIIALSTTATVTDLARGRIYNWLTFPAIAAGLVVSAVSGGMHGAGDALAGMAAGLALYGWMFWIGVMGAGDVKFLMALGAWGGLHYSVEVAILGVILGGFMALAVLAAKGRLADFARRLRQFVLSLVVKELEFQAPEIDRKLKMPFGLAISAAAVWIALQNPFERWGFRLWS